MIRTVPITSIVPSPLHRRRIWQLDELVESMKVHGQIDPGIGRPCPTDPDKIEAVDCHRRLKAAPLAGLEELRIDVLELTDEQVLEMMLTIEGQRVASHPLDEAELFGELRERGVSTEDIAARVGKGKTYVFQRLALLGLVEAWQKAFVADKVTTGGALLLARLPPEQQAAAAKSLIGRHDDEPLDAREVANEVRYRIARRLVDTPFDIAREDLAGAPACTRCPKSSAVQRGLYGNADLDGQDGKAQCLDGACYDKKTKAHGDEIVAKAKAEGAKMLTAAEAKELFPYAHSGLQAKGFVDLRSKANPLGHGAKDPTWGKVVEKAKTPVDVVLAKNPHTGEIHRLVSAPVVKKLAREVGYKWAQPPEKPKAAPKSPAALDAELAGIVERRAIGEIVAKIEKATPDAAWWREVVIGLFLLGNCRDVVERRGWKLKSKWGGPSEKEALAIVEPMSAPELRGLVWELAFDGAGEGPLGKAAERYGVDVAAIRATVKAEAKEAEKAKAKGKAAAPAKGKKKLPPSGACRECGCTETTPCDTDHGPCAWVEPDLCSGCAPAGDEEPKASKKKLPGLDVDAAGKALAAARSDEDRVLEACRSKASATAVEKATGLPRATVDEALQALFGKGHLSIGRNGKTKVYTATSTALAELDGTPAPAKGKKGKAS